MNGFSDRWDVAQRTMDYILMAIRITIRIPGFWMIRIQEFFKKILYYL